MLKINKIFFQVIGFYLFLAWASAYAQEKNLPPPNPDSSKQIEFANRGAVEIFSTLIDTITTLSDDLEDIEGSMEKITIQKLPGDPVEKQDTQFDMVIGNKIIEKILKTRKMHVYECVECKKTIINIKENNISVEKIFESNSSLNKVGHALGIEGFLFWNTYMENHNAILSLRLVDSRKGRIVWGKQYSVLEKIKEEKKEKEEEEKIKKTFTLSTGVWGIKSKRKKITDGSEEILEKNGTLTFMVQTQTKSPFLTFGVGADIFATIVDRDILNMEGISLFPIIEIRIDPLFTGKFEKKDNKKIDSINYYIAIGEVFYKTFHNEIFKSGINFNLSSILKFSIGTVYIPSSKVVFNPLNNYEKEGNFGGLGYDVNVGVMF